ncbi:MAG: hypothetical protein Sylvanvirus13_10 [Sylvanvirus sp.]|uniref:AAA+ ATPase domain-containing protein n=1 Tax=Sylvanvirus sp. TaxID=2487774 RepID=A0A3G5AKQ9_9VIRU|nr:MAG: hypothetical protein Sylvanvirus13_10 [Sylvanvirus sp.]
MNLKAVIVSKGNEKENKILIHSKDLHRIVDPHFPGHTFAVRYRCPFILTNPTFVVSDTPFRLTNQIVVVSNTSTGSFNDCIVEPMFRSFSKLMIPVIVCVNDTIDIGTLHFENPSEDMKRCIDMKSIVRLMRLPEQWAKTHVEIVNKIEWTEITRKTKHNDTDPPCPTCDKFNEIPISIPAIVTKLQYTLDKQLFEIQHNISLRQYSSKKARVLASTATGADKDNASDSDEEDVKHSPLPHTDDITTSSISPIGCPHSWSISEFKVTKINKLRMNDPVLDATSSESKDMDGQNAQDGKEYSTLFTQLAKDFNSNPSGFDAHDQLDELCFKNFSKSNSKWYLTHEKTKWSIKSVIEKQNAQSKLFKQSEILQKIVQSQGSFNYEDLGVGGLNEIMNHIFIRVLEPRRFSFEVRTLLGIRLPRGLVLHGAPGNGKTLIARQLAQKVLKVEPQLVNGPELLSKWWGESESNVRKLFEPAEQAWKAGDKETLHVVILDEFDALGAERSSGGSGGETGNKIVTQFLSKMDGVNTIDNILFIALTNRFNSLDPALLRPGRFEVHIEIPLPDEKGREEILLVHTEKLRKAGFLSETVDLKLIAQKTDTCSGADLESIVQCAQSCALHKLPPVQSSYTINEFKKLQFQVTQEMLLQVIPDIVNRKIHEQKKPSKQPFPFGEMLEKLVDLEYTEK